MNYFGCKQYRCFNDSDDAKNWGRKYYKDFSVKYEEFNQQLEQLNYIHNSSYCVEHFCGFGYKEMNRYLRNNTIDSVAKSYTEALTFTILLAPPIPEDIIVYRLVCHEFVEELKRGNFPVVEKGFLSTSMTTTITKLNEHYADYDDMLQIYVPKGLRGLYVDEITTRQENEVIIIPNTYIRLIKKPLKKICGKNLYICEALNL